MSPPDTNNELMQVAVGQINSMVTGTSPGNSGGTVSPGAPTQQGNNMVAQSVAQSMAIAVQDVVDLMRNISAIETSAIGAATAKWIAEPENVFYPVIIEKSTETMAEIATLMKTVGENTAYILNQYVMKQP